MQTFNPEYDNDLKTLIRRKAIAKVCAQTGKSKLSKTEWDKIVDIHYKMYLSARHINSEENFRNFFTITLLSSKGGWIYNEPLDLIFADLNNNWKRLKHKTITALLSLVNGRAKKKTEPETQNKEVAETEDLLEEETEEDLLEEV